MIEITRRRVHQEIQVGARVAVIMDTEQDKGNEPFHDDDILIGDTGEVTQIGEDGLGCPIEVTLDRTESEKYFYPVELEVIG